MERRSPRFSAVPKAMASVLSLGPFTIDGGQAREGAGHCRGDSMGPFLAWPVPVDHPQGQRPILISQDDLVSKTVKITVCSLSHPVCVTVSRQS